MKNRNIKKVQIKPGVVVIRFEGGQMLEIKPMKGVDATYDGTKGDRSLLKGKEFKSLKFQTDCSTLAQDGQLLIMGYNHILINGEDNDKLLYSFKVKALAKEFNTEHLMFEVIEK